MACLDPDSDLPCYQKAHVLDWTLWRICPKVQTGLCLLSKQEWDNTESDFKSNILVECVQVGFNIAVRANSDEGESFWVMLITKGEHVNTKAFTEDFGNDFVPSEKLI